MSRIVVSENVCQGQPRIAGTRITVQQIVDLFNAGVSINAIISDDYYPDIIAEDVQACIDYAKEP